MSYHAGQPKQKYSALGSGVKPLPLGNSARRHVTVGRQAQSFPAASGSKLPLTFGPSAATAAPSRPGDTHLPPQQQHQQQRPPQQQHQQQRPPQQSFQHSRQPQQQPPPSSTHGQGNASHSVNPSIRPGQHQHQTGGLRAQQPGSLVRGQHHQPPLHPPQLQPQQHAQGREGFPHAHQQPSSRSGDPHHRERPIHSSTVPVEAATSAQVQPLRSAQTPGQLPSQPPVATARGSVVTVGPAPQAIPGANSGNERGVEVLDSSSNGLSSASGGSADVSEELRRLRQEVARQRVDLAERDDALRAMVDQVQKKDEEMFDLQASLAVSEAELKANSEEAQKALAGQANFQQQDLINEQRARARLEQQLREERAKTKLKSNGDSLNSTTGCTPSQSPRLHKGSRTTTAGGSGAAVVAPTPNAPPSQQQQSHAPLGRQVENALGNNESAASLRRDLSISACIVTRGDYAAGWRTRERDGLTKLLQTDLNARTLVLWRPHFEGTNEKNENVQGTKSSSTNGFSLTAGHTASEGNNGDENGHDNATADGLSAMCLDRDGVALVSTSASNSTAASLADAPVPAHPHAGASSQSLKAPAAVATKEALISESSGRDNSFMSPLSHNFLGAQALLADCHGMPYEDALSTLLTSILAFIRPLPGFLHDTEMKMSPLPQQAHVPTHVSEAAWALMLAVLRRASTSISDLLFPHPAELPSTPTAFDATTPKESKSSSSSAGRRSSSSSKRKSGSSGSSDNGNIPATIGVWGSIGDALSDDFSDLCFGNTPVSRDEVQDTWMNLLEDITACSAMGDPGLIQAGVEIQKSSTSAISASSRQMDTDAPSTTSTPTCKESPSSSSSSSSASAARAESQMPPTSDLAVSLRDAVLEALRHSQLASPSALQSALLVLHWCLLFPHHHTTPRGDLTKSSTSSARTASAVEAPQHNSLEFWTALIDPSDGIYYDSNNGGGGNARESDNSSDNRRPSSSSNRNSAEDAAGEPLFVRGGILGALLSCDALPSADHELLVVQVLGCLLPHPSLFQLASSHQAPLSSSSSGFSATNSATAATTTPHAANDATTTAPSTKPEASSSSLTSAAAPADLISTLCKLMLRRSSPQPDSLRDGSSNGRLNEDAIEQRLLGQVAAAHRVSREVIRLLGLVLSLYRHSGGLDAVLAPRSLKDKAQDGGEVLVEGENLLSLCTGLRYTFAVLVEEIDHELGYNRGPFPHVSPTSEVAASSSAKPTNAKGSSSDSSSSSSGSGAAEDNAACARAIAELRAAHWDNDLWALRASHIALLREGIVLVTQDLVIQGLEERWSMTLHEVLRGHLGAWPLHSLASKLLTYAHSAQVLGTASSGNSSSAGLSTPGVGASDPGLTSGCSELLAVEEDLKYLVDQCADPMLSAEGAEEEEEDSATEVEKSKGAAESCDSSEFDLFVEHA